MVDEQNVSAGVGASTARLRPSGLKGICIVEQKIAELSEWGLSLLPNNGQ